MTRDDEGLGSGPAGGGADGGVGVNDVVACRAGGAGDFEAWRERKRLAAEGLAAVDVEGLGLRGTDGRLEDYLLEVRGRPEGHNLYEVLAAARFARLLEGYRWDAATVRRFVRFYETLRFSGTAGRRRYRLTPVQVFQFASMLGFVRDDGSRLTRQAILFVPRKFSKTTSAASLAVWELLTGDANAQAYTAANSYKQARVCFDEIRKIVRQFDPQGRVFKTTREHIEWRQPNRWGRESFAECLTGGAETKDGLNASLVVFDEYAAARYVAGHSDGAALLQVLQSSMGARRQPLSVVITTASRVQDGPFQLMLEGAKRVLLGEAEDDGLFASLFMPDAWETDDGSLGRPEVWRKCNPHIGVTVRESFYRESWARALRDPEEMLEFRSKMVNLFVADSVKEWIGADLARQLSCDFRPEALRGRPDAMCAFDLSVSDDFSVVAYAVYSRAAKKFYVWCDFYIPEETVRTHPNGRLYEYWIGKGYMKACPGKVVDLTMVANDILARNRQMRIVQIGYDAYKAQEVVNILAAGIASEGGRPDGILRPVPQTYGQFNSPVESFEMAAKSRHPRVALADNPVIFYCFGNCYIDEDRMGNKKPVKRKANLKIDAAVAALMCFWLFMNTDQRG